MKVARGAPLFATFEAHDEFASGKMHVHPVDFVAPPVTGMIERREDDEEPLLAEPPAIRRSEVSRKPEDGIELRHVASRRNVLRAGEVAAREVADARLAVEAKKVRDVTAFELLRFGSEERGKERLRARAHVFVRTAQADANGSASKLRKAREGLRYRASVAIEAGKERVVRARHRQKVLDLDGFSEERKHSAHPRGVLTDQRDVRVSVRQKLRVRRQRTIRKDHLDIERSEDDTAATITTEHEIFPMQIGDAEPAKERERTADGDGELGCFGG
jgi:hypothetical protein